MSSITQIHIDAYENDGGFTVSDLAADTDYYCSDERAVTEIIALVFKKALARHKTRADFTPPITRQEEFE